MHEIEAGGAILGQRLAVASGQHDRHADAAIADRLREIEPGHPGHHHVGEYDVEAICVHDQLGKRVGGIVDQRDAVAELGEAVGGEIGELDIVLDHQHRHAAAGHRRRGVGRLPLRQQVWRHARQIEREGAALPHLALDGHLAAGLPGEAEHLRQAETGALADLLGGEERLEDAARSCGGNADAGVADGDADEAMAACKIRLRRDVHRVSGTVAAACTAKVILPLPCMASRALVAMLISAVSNWPASALTRQGSAGSRDRDLDRRPEQRGEHVVQRLHAFADVERLRLQGLAPREGQQLRGQLGGARDRVRDRGDVALPPLLAQLRPVQQVDRGADHGQEVVEVVRDAAGELSQRLQRAGCA